ncbi:MAG: glycoside hydrolase family 38 C-terminal domain-containing protein [Bacteroidota bacterium]
MKYLLTVLSIISFSLGFAQVGDTIYYQGFDQEIGGTNFGYHSPIPDINTSLILRGKEEYDPISWKTEAVPKNYKGKYITFIWIFAMDVTSDPSTFKLKVNGKKYFSFENSKKSELGIRSFEGEKGAELILNASMIDKYNDQMGFALLKLPVKSLTPGQPVLLEISSETIDNDAWYMTYKGNLIDKVEVYQNKVVAKNDGKLFHSVSVDFTHIGAESEASITIGDVKRMTKLNTGFNKLEIYLPKVDRETSYTAQIKVGKNDVQQIPVKLMPVKEWEIYLVQHTHTDIGYTRPQTEILPEHLRYIDHALDYCDQTDDYPDAAKFRWTIETSWSLREYLKSRPQEQIDRLIKRLKEGRIEATGMFLNFSEIIDEPALVTQTKTLRMLKENGVDVITAMQNDVNGIGWSMVDNYHNTDVKYLTMGIHAHRARKPFNKPTTFWWQSPAGNRLLAYRSEHYQYANTLGINTSEQDVLRNNISKYLSGLEEKNYPYNKVALQFSGYVTDNSPPSTEACDIIKEWNEKYEWPKLRSSLSSELPVYLEEQHQDEIPEKKVAWPDWWTDGTASAANETKVVRETQTSMVAITSILAMGKIMGVALPEDLQNEIEEVYDNILFYDEHTHGASESVSDPLVQNTINQWAMKSAYAWEASKKAHALEEKTLALIESALNKSSLPTIAVFNTLNWKRSDMVELFIESTIVPEGADFTITDSEGRKVPYQKYMQRPEGAYFGLWVKDVPPMGYKVLQVNSGKTSNAIPKVKSEAFENEFYKISIDEKKGVVSRIFDKELQLELIDPNDTLTLGQFIYEELDNRHELERLTASNRDTVYKPIGLKRTLMDNIRLTKRTNGAIYNSIFLKGDMPVCTDYRGVKIEIRLYHHQKKIEFLYDMIKLPVTSPEGVYIAFPFHLDKGNLAFEVQGGVVYPGINQLEGSSSDWNTLQNFASVRNDKAQIVFVSDETPLVQFGAINTGRYYYRLKPKTNHIYSWVLNNYWVTNFKASQRGELQWTYSITSTDDNSDMAATKFGWGSRIPFKSRIMLPTVGVNNTELQSKSLINLDIPNLLMVSASLSLDKKGIILHLREVEGDHAMIDINRLLKETGASSIHEVNALEEDLTLLTAPLLFEHYETKFIKLNFER